MESEVHAKGKQMRFRYDIQTFEHPSQAWRALVTWVEDTAPKLYVDRDGEEGAESDFGLYVLIQRKILLQS